LHLPINENKKNALDTWHSITQANVDCILKVIVITYSYVICPLENNNREGKKSESFSDFIMKQIND
jgi:hypothetical protein